MSWKGTWRNQYGSTVTITQEENGEVRGIFRTALLDSAFYGQEAPILGLCRGDLITFAASGRGSAGDVVVSYTGMLRDSHMETVWSFIADGTLTATGEGAPASISKTNWWRAVVTNVDTFERVDGPAVENGRD